MITIVNYIPKVQAFDKSAATITEIKSQISDVNVITVICLNEKHQIEDITSLMEIIEEVSEIILLVGKSTPENKDRLRLSEKYCKKIKTDAENIVNEIQEFVPERSRVVLFAPVGTSGNVIDLLLGWATAKKVPILGYFKSLHDQGMGLSTRLDSSAVTRILRKIKSIKRGIFQKKKKINSGKLEASDTKWLLVFNDSHKKIVSKFSGNSKLVSVGYQLLFPKWRELVEQSSYSKGYPRGERLEVVLFTRGETPGRPPEENVVPHDNLGRLMTDIFTALDDTGRGWYLRIKPHPIQDVAFLRSIIADRANVEIVYEAPALLAATADLAISTYSSTVVDTLAFGVPTIEYFFETPFFQAKHPTGSPFPELGAMKARTRAEFVSSLRDALCGPVASTPTLSSLSKKPNFRFLITDNKPANGLAVDEFSKNDQIVL